MPTTGNVVIYTRYSTDRQREESCEDQERVVRAGLDRMKIDHQSALVIQDKAMSGSKADRSGYQRLIEMRDRGEIAILAVDEQSRFSRGGTAASEIQDFVFAGARFISTSEGIDTTQRGWKMQTKIGEIHNEQATELTANRVRRGMQGRVIEDGSAGDFPYGYESYFVDPDAALRCYGRGPKPKKAIRIRQEHAAWVRKIFEWFAIDHKSMTQIAKDLNSQKAPRRERARTLAWQVYSVRAVLTNTKYVGRWPWGAFTTIRNSRGQKKYVPVEDPQAKEVRTREHLRLIDDATWKAAQARLARNKSISGRKPGQKARGWYHHRTGEPSKHLLSGLLECGSCGHRLYRNGSGKTCTMYCPASRNDECGMKFSVNVTCAESALMSFIAEFVLASDSWLNRTWERTRELVRASIDHVPAELAAVELGILRADAQVAELIKELANVGPAKDLIRRTLDELALSLEELQKRKEQLRTSTITIDSLPDADWFRDQLQSLPDLCSTDPIRMGYLLRQMLGSVRVHPMTIPGKTRGYTQLRFNIQSPDALLALSDGRIPDAVTDSLRRADSSDRLNFAIDVGGPTKADRLRPIVAELRTQGLTIRQIAEQLGEQVHNIEAYSRRR